MVKAVNFDTTTVTVPPSTLCGRDTLPLLSWHIECLKGRLKMKMVQEEKCGIEMSRWQNIISVSLESKYRGHYNPQVEVLRGSAVIKPGFMKMICGTKK